MVHRLLLAFAIVGVVAIVVVGLGFLPLSAVPPHPGAQEGEPYVLFSDFQLMNGGRIEIGLGGITEITLPAGTSHAVIRLTLSNAGLGDAMNVTFAVAVGDRDLMWCEVGMFGCSSLNDMPFNVAEGQRMVMELHVPMLFAGTMTFWPFTVQLVDDSPSAVPVGPNSILFNRGL